VTAQPARLTARSLPQATAQAAWLTAQAARMPTLVTTLCRLHQVITQAAWLTAQAARMPTLVTTLCRLHRAISQQ